MKTTMRDFINKLISYCSKHHILSAYIYHWVPKIKIVNIRYMNTTQLPKFKTTYCRYWTVKKVIIRKITIVTILLLINILAEKSKSYLSYSIKKYQLKWTHKSYENNSYEKSSQKKSYKIIPKKYILLMVNDLIVCKLYFEPLILNISSYNQ